MKVVPIDFAIAGGTSASSLFPLVDDVDVLGLGAYGLRHCT